MKKLFFLIALPITAICFYAFSVEHQYVTMPIETVKHESRPFIIPIEVDAITRISPFGMRKNPLTESTKVHKGIDFVAASGTKIFTVADGIVSSVEFSDDGYGNKVEIEHEGGVVTRYAHLNTINVTQGAAVKQGETIAKCGSTGLSTGPHLHFEVIRDGEHLDPEQFLSLTALQNRLTNLNVDRDALTVILDAGHGGNDNGATNGTANEKEICLEYAMALKGHLESQGISTIITRSADESISLEERTALTSNQKEGLYISLHVNQSESEDASGFEVYIPESSHAHHDKSMKFAQLLQQGLSKQQIESRGTKTANFWVLKNAECPAVLIELGFMTSSDDLKHLGQSSYQEEWSKQVAASILKYTE